MLMLRCAALKYRKKAIDSSETLTAAKGNNISN
jgi:hypothetical protein